MTDGTMIRQVLLSIQLLLSISKQVVKLEETLHVFIVSLTVLSILYVH